MENLTHTLIGVLLARAALPWVGSLRGALWAGIFASNAPDLDILLNPFYADARLGYLVHHRGHTHTVPGALLLGLGCAVVAARFDPAARRPGLVGLALVAAFLHVGADAWNNYGVHPFWPWDSTWRYGDMVFILEPLLWMALLPVAFTIASRRTRIGLGLLGVGLAGVTAFGLGPAAAVAWGLATVALTAVQARWDRLVTPVVVLLGVLGAFALGTHRAEALVRARLASDRPAEEVLDVVLSPKPSTPWCWTTIALTRDATTWNAREALVSLAPGVTPPEECVVREPGGRTAPLLAADLADDADVRWGARFSAPIAELRTLAEEECRVDAFLHYARAPFWLVEGDRVVVGDLRYDYEPEVSWAEVETTRTTPPDTRGCDRLPPWRSPPVESLLGG